MGKRKIPDVRVSATPDMPKPLAREDTLDLTADSYSTTSAEDRRRTTAPVLSPEVNEPGSEVSAPKIKGSEAKGSASQPERAPSTDRADNMLYARRLLTRWRYALVGAVFAVIVVAGFFISNDTNERSPSVSDERSSSTESDPVAVPAVDETQTLQAADTAGEVMSDPAALSVAILDLTAAMRRSDGFEQQLKAVLALSENSQRPDELDQLTGLVGRYAPQGVPSNQGLRELLPILKLEVEVFSGLEPPSSSRRLFLSALAFFSEEANDQLTRFERTQAIFEVTANQLEADKLLGAIAALSHLEPTQKNVAQGYVDLVRARLALNDAARLFETHVLNNLNS